MNLDKFTERARTVIQAAQMDAIKRKNQYFTPEHILKAMLDDEKSLAASLIKSAGGRPDEARLAADVAVAGLSAVEGSETKLYMQPETAQVIAGAEQAAEKMGDSFEGPRRLTP
ncbi:MAG: hypothetical protein MUF14_11265 [Hyphomonadaceae bacterium]|nr:hypothetical protein [Hyphomonadaceae bacterium]